MGAQSIFSVANLIQIQKWKEIRQELIQKLQNLKVVELHLVENRRKIEEKVKEIQKEKQKATQNQNTIVFFERIRNRESPTNSKLLFRNVQTCYRNYALRCHDLHPAIIFFTEPFC